MCWIVTRIGIMRLLCLLGIRSIVMGGFDGLLPRRFCRFLLLKMLRKILMCQLLGAVSLCHILWRMRILVEVFTPLKSHTYSHYVLISSLHYLSVLPFYPSQFSWQHLAPAHHHYHNIYLFAHCRPIQTVQQCISTFYMYM